MCPPESPCRGASIIHPHAQCVYFWYGNAATRTFGRARRHRPYGFVWILRTDVAPTISFGQIAHETVDFVWMDCVQMVILFVWDCVAKYDEVG